MRLGHLDHSLIFNGNHKLYEKTVVISLQFKWINLYFKRIKWMSYMIKKRKGKTSSWFPQTRKEQTSPIPYCLCLFTVFFHTGRAGEECWEQGFLSVLRPYRHLAENVWSGPSCELLFARPSSGGRSDQCRTNRSWTQAWPLSTFFSAVWQDQWTVRFWA